MRSSHLLALAVTVLAAACGGSVQDPNGGNSNGALSGDGEQGGGGDTGASDAGAGGATGGGAGVGGAGGATGGSAGIGGAGGWECKSDAECPTVGAPCKVCPDGQNASCPESACISGQCVVAWSTCPAPVADGGAGGGVSDGGSGGPVCKSDGECAAPAVCQVCPDGENYSCATAACVYGQCEVFYPPCPDVDGGASIVQCGGFAGFPCPGIGQCVDVPNDSCDPQHGGADCPGMCTCSGALVDCAPGYAFDASPSVCTCVPVNAP